MKEKDRPIKCNNHVWYPFLDHKLKTINLTPMLYHRICGICGKIELRDKLKTSNKLWEDLINEWKKW